MSEKREERPSRDAIQEIEDRLKALKGGDSGILQDKDTSAHSIGRMMWLSFNVISDLIAGIICGLGIGYGLDSWLRTRPFFIAVFLILGCIAGVLNVIRFLRRYEERIQEDQKIPKGKE